MRYSTMARGTDGLWVTWPCICVVTCMGDRSSKPGLAQGMRRTGIQRGGAEHRTPHRSCRTCMQHTRAIMATWSDRGAVSCSPATRRICGVWVRDVWVSRGKGGGMASCCSSATRMARHAQDLWGVG